jgi:hypothetical protein
VIDCSKRSIYLISGTLRVLYNLNWPSHNHNSEERFIIQFSQAVWMQIFVEIQEESTANLWFMIHMKYFLNTFWHYDTTITISKVVVEALPWCRPGKIRRRWALASVLVGAKWWLHASPMGMSRSEAVIARRRRWAERKAWFGDGGPDLRAGFGAWRERFPLDLALCGSSRQVKHAYIGQAQALGA